MTLTAVEDASAGAASGEAAAIRIAARRRAEQILDQARTEATVLVQRRRRTAHRYALAHEQEQLAAARAQARATVLRARRSVLTEARAAAHAAARGLPGDPRFERLLERLAAQAAERLRGAGPVSVTPTADGGLVAVAGNRQLDYSLAAQVDRCMQAMGAELEHLWR